MRDLIVYSAGETQRKCVGITGDRGAEGAEGASGGECAPKAGGPATLARQSQECGEI